jgi:glycosyltransferase involved in cell wall biosynthesis
MVSVVIPVFNDAKRLEICLKAIDQQTYPKACYEVIVVDNDSEFGLVIASVVAQFKRAIVAFETIPGSYAARNRGIELAKGEVLAFTDADCIPAKDWIERGVWHLLQTQNCGLVAGRIEVFFQDPTCITPIELYESITAFPQSKLLETRHGGATANVFTLKAVFEQVGLFDPTLKSNGDLEWGYRVFLAGYRQIYADDALVAHPARSTYQELYQRTVRLVGGAQDVRKKYCHSSVQHMLFFIEDLLKSLVPPLMFMWCTFSDSRLKGFQQKLNVSLVMFFVRYVTAWELIRLKLGGTSSRG